MTRFRAPVEYRRTTEGRDPGSVSRFAGMPIGLPQMNVDWQWEYTSMGGLSSQFATADWAKTKVGASGDPAVTVSGGFSFLNFVNTAADDDAIQIQNTGNGVRWLATGDRPIYFETMARFRDANNDAATVTQIDWFLGLALADTTLLAGATDFVGFSKIDQNDDATNRIALVAGKAGGAAGLLRDQSVTSTGWVANTAPTTLATDRGNRRLCANQWIKVAFLLEPHTSGAAGDLFGWINNEPVPAAGPVSLGSNVPDAAMCVSFAVRNGEAVIKQMDIAYYFVAQALYDDSVPPVFV